MADTKAEQEVLDMIAEQRLPFSAAILNGGHARRFGGIDKQEVEIEGVPTSLTSYMKTLVPLSLRMI